MERNKRDVFEILIVIRRSDVSDVSFSSSEIFMESEENNFWGNLTMDSNLRFSKRLRRC